MFKEKHHVQLSREENIHDQRWKGNENLTLRIKEISNLDWFRN